MNAKEMLTAMLGRLQNADAAELAEIADALAEATAEDRLEFLRAMGERLLLARRDILNMRYSNNPDGRDLRCEYVVRELSATSARYAADALRDRMAQSVSDACERGRWYAVKFAALAARREGYEPYDERHVLRVSASVVPLDGGRVLGTDDNHT